MGSKYETPFWDYAKKFSFEDPFFDECLEYIKNNPDYIIPGLTDFNYAQWHAYSIKNWYDGMV